MNGRREIVWGAVIVALVLAVFSLASEGGFRRSWKLQEDVQSYRALIRRLEDDNGRLRRQVQALKEDPAALERAVREELGFIRPGELVITLEESP